jgi:Xaa-Pro aminopeptidase
LLCGTPGECSDFRYASGFALVDPAVYVEHRRQRYLVVSEMEKGRAQREALAGVRVLTPSDVDARSLRKRGVSSWALALLRKLKVRRVVVSARFPLSTAEHLRRNGMAVRVLSPLFPRRERKTAAEAAFIRQSQRAAARAMRQAVSLIARSRIARSGWLLHERRRLTAERVRREIELSLLQSGCGCADAIVAGGAQGANPHERGSGPLRAHTAIVIDIFPRHGERGYWGDLTRTVVRGRAPDRIRRMHRAVRAAQRVALGAVRAGATGRSIHRAAHAEFRRRGFITRLKGAPCGFIHGTGHGVGLDIHEAPSLNASGGRLKTGHVVTVEPGLYYPGVGGVRIEDTVLVTARGCRILASAGSWFEL